MEHSNTLPFPYAPTETADLYAELDTFIAYLEKQHDD